MTAVARRPRIWTVALFALHVLKDDGEPACRRARRLLKRLDEKHGGALLIRTPGTNREFTFLPATLARLEADLFTPIEALDFRVDELEQVVEEGLERLSAQDRALAAQTRQNSNDIAKMRARVRAA